MLIYNPSNCEKDYFWENLKHIWLDFWGGKSEKEDFSYSMKCYHFLDGWPELRHGPKSKKATDIELSFGELLHGYIRKKSIFKPSL